MTGGGGPSPDWIAALHSPLAEGLSQILRALPFGEIQRYPPPKRGSGLPLGRELRIARRFRRGESSQLDPSAFSALYRRAAGRDLDRLFRAFVIGDALPAAAWQDLLGHEACAWWESAGLLRGAVPGGLACAFRVIVVAGLQLVTDPLDRRFRHRVHIGQDSLNFVEFLRARREGGAARFLDVGTGSGVVLLALAPEAGTALGVDVNPRAVVAARFNAALNGAEGCEVRHADVFDPGAALGRFDLVTWNLPFMFFPDSLRDESVDGYGGRLGIEVTLRFVERLVELLAPGGRAWLVTAAPMLDDGVDALGEALGRLPAMAALDVVMHVRQAFWAPAFRALHRAHRIDRFESVVLAIRHGAGRLIRIEAPLASRLVDRARGAVYRLKRRD